MVLRHPDLEATPAGVELHAGQLEPRPALSLDLRPGTLRCRPGHLHGFPANGQLGRALDVGIRLEVRELHRAGLPDGAHPAHPLLAHLSAALVHRPEDHHRPRSGVLGLVAPLNASRCWWGGARRLTITAG